MKKFLKNSLLFGVSSFILSSVLADNIEYHNRTGSKIYVAPYYYHASKASRISDPKPILPKSDLIAPRPAKKAGGYTRYALFSKDEKDLKKELSKDVFEESKSIQIGTGFGPDFSIKSASNNELIAYEDSHADNIVFHNLTGSKIYVAAYYYYELKATRISPPQLILPKSDLLIARPAKKINHVRYALFSIDETDFTEKLTRDEFMLFKSLQIGGGTGADYFVDFDMFNALFVYDTTPASATKQNIRKTNEEFLASLKEPIKEPLKEQYTDPKKYPHANEIAKVRFSKDISPEEKKFLQTRLAKVSTQIENVLHKKVDANSAPRIALCFSGGGFRAMLATLAFLIAAKDVGLLGYVSYMSALSGSSWAIGPWVTSDLSLDSYFNQLLPRIKSGLFAQQDIHLKEDLECYLKKSIFNQPITLIDVFGTILTHKLLYGFSSHANPNNISLDEQKVQISTGDIPLPIYTAIITKKDPNYQWFEFTPFECGSNYLGGYIPSWSFGRLFNNGQTVGKEPPQSLGYILGICGSAISVNFLEMWEKHFKKADIFKPFAKTMENFDTVEFGRIRLNPAKVWNYTVGVANLPRRDQDTIALIDAGIDFNLPIFPLLRKERAVDLIIMLDASADVKSAKTLGKVYERAAKENIKMPPLNIEEAKTSVCTVLRDKNDPSVPVIIYMPVITNKHHPLSFDLYKEISSGFLSTFNFQYTEKQAREFADLIKFNLDESTNFILKEIERVIDKKKGVKPAKT